ncbi:hypothetical protein GCM10022221_31910 [Actinocorallia aurea]
MGAILEHRPSGRILRRSPTGEVDVVLDSLYFANGLALTPDGAALLLAETTGPTLSRVPLTGPRAGTREVVAANLPGYPDNLSRFTGGRAWVALTNPHDPALDRLATAPAWAARALWALPDRLRPSGTKTTWVLPSTPTAQSSPTSRPPTPPTPWSPASPNTTATSTSPGSPTPPSCASTRPGHDAAPAFTGRRGPHRRAT